MNYTINADKKISSLITGISFTISSAGKKAHIVQIYPDGLIEPMCGSGINHAGATWRRPSRYIISQNKNISADQLCSKCSKNEYVVEAK